MLTFMQKLQKPIYILNTLFLKFTVFIQVMVAVYNQIRITEQALFLEIKLAIKVISSVHTCNALVNEYPNGKYSTRIPKL